MTAAAPTPDSRPHWSHRLPTSVRPYASLARWDRPVGYWLLALPGWIGIALALLTVKAHPHHALLGALILIGAIAMRGAGCTYNDIVDRDLDAQVERTRARPLPSGAVSVRGAWMWLVAQCLVGLLVLLALPNLLSQAIALAALPLVAAYPFMKRITGFPQVWLGLTFNWAALVAYVAMTGELSVGAVLLYSGLAAWTLGYDTIYALQDIEDDQLAGIKSSAISFGDNVRAGVGTAYAVAVLLIASAIAKEATVMATLAMIPFAIGLAWQVAQLSRDEPAQALRLFKANGLFGMILFTTIAFVALYLR